MASNVVSFKCCLLGDSNAGKSCLAIRFSRGTYYDYTEATIGAAFLTQTVQLEDCIIRFELWDTAGQERYRSLAPMYYRGAAAAVVVFDVTNRESFEGAKSWVKELQRRGDPSVVIALAGNKADIKEGRVVEAAEASDYARDQGIIYMDTSAKTGQNVTDIFVAIARKLPRSSKAKELDVIGDLADSKPKAKSGVCCGGGGGASGGAGSA